MKKDITVREHLTSIASMKTEKKARTSKKNGSKRPYICKTASFVSSFHYPLESNEWKATFPTGQKTPTGRVETYNPDFYCKKLGVYIEVATSGPNISICGPKWRTMLKKGLNFRIFWWEGQDITDYVLEKEMPPFARPKRKE